MRIAVCLAGQPRTWKICYKNLRKSFEAPGIKVDYFIHTWSENGSDYRGYPHEILDPKDLKKGLIEAYSPKLIQIESYTDLGLERWYSHRHSICSSLKLCQSWEKTHSFKYDWVFYSRLDFCRFWGVNYEALRKILKTRDKEELEYYTLYGGEVNWCLDMGYYAEDFSWFGSSTAMAKLSFLEQDFLEFERISRENPNVFREYCAEDFFPVFAINRLIRLVDCRGMWDVGCPVRQCLEKFPIKLETEEGMEVYRTVVDNYGWYYTEDQLQQIFFKQDTRQQQLI